PLKALSAATGQTLDELAPEEHWLLKLETSILRPPWKMPEEFRHFLVDEEMFDEAFDEDEEADLAKRPLAPEEEEDQAVRALQHQFGGAVAYLDQWVASLLEDLQARHLLDQIILVITSDSGQSLGERGADVPGVPLLHEERIHIPLLLRLPEGT